MADPLSKINIKELIKVAALAAEAGLKCERATQAGVDVSDDAIRCDHLKKSVQQMLDVYNSNKNWNIEEGRNG